MRRFLCGFAFLFVCSASQAAQNELRSGVFKPPRLAPEFSLSGSDGTTLELNRFRGKKIVALGFGFTHCPDVCPTTLAKLAQARKALGSDAKDLQVVYITVDPERDTPTRLREYLGAFDPTFLGATGGADQLEQVRKAYGIVAAKETSSGGNYLVHHSSFVYLIDREGKLRALIPQAGSVDDMVHDVKALSR